MCLCMWRVKGNNVMIDLRMKHSFNLFENIIIIVTNKIYSLKDHDYHTNESNLAIIMSKKYSFVITFCPQNHHAINSSNRFEDFNVAIINSDY